MGSGICLNPPTVLLENQQLRLSVAAYGLSTQEFKDLFSHVSPINDQRDLTAKQGPWQGSP
jgi:hypothetical protein